MPLTCYLTAPRVSFASVQSHDLTINILKVGTKIDTSNAGNTEALINNQMGQEFLLMWLRAIHIIQALY